MEGFYHYKRVNSDMMYIWKKPLKWEDYWKINGSIINAMLFLHDTWKVNSNYTDTRSSTIWWNAFQSPMKPFYRQHTEQNLFISDFRVGRNIWLWDFRSRCLAIVWNSNRQNKWLCLHSWEQRGKGEKEDKNKGMPQRSGKDRSVADG